MTYMNTDKYTSQAGIGVRNYHIIAIVFLKYRQY
jgi:hypothetical protein